MQHFPLIDVIRTQLCPSTYPLFEISLPPDVVRLPTWLLVEPNNYLDKVICINTGSYSLFSLQQHQPSNPVTFEMQFTTFITLAAFFSATLAAVAPAPVPMKRDLADPENPANLVNCEPNGGADDCHLEQPVSSLLLTSSKWHSFPSQVRPYSPQLR